MASSFRRAIKNISMGMASRAQKQRMHADAHPILNPKKCNRCGLCAEVCPTGAAILPVNGNPVYDLKACIGCSQCLPSAAGGVEGLLDTNMTVFQERLVETAAVIWREIGAKRLSSTPSFRWFRNVTACRATIGPLLRIQDSSSADTRLPSMKSRYASSARNRSTAPMHVFHGRGSSPMLMRSALCQLNKPSCDYSFPPLSRFL